MIPDSILFHLDYSEDYMPRCLERKLNETCDEKGRVLDEEERKLRESAYRTILSSLWMLPFGFDQVNNYLNDLERMALMAEKPYSPPFNLSLARGDTHRYITAYLIKELVKIDDALDLCHMILEDEDESPLLKLRAALVLTASQSSYSKFRGN